MRFESFVEHGKANEDGTFTPAQVGTKLIAENEADEVIIKQIIEMEQKRAEAWVDWCLKGIYKEG